MRILKCVDCRWHPDDGDDCQHPDALADPITGEDHAAPLSMEEMRIPRLIIIDADSGEYMKGSVEAGYCGIEARLFDFKVDPFGR